MAGKRSPLLVIFFTVFIDLIGFCIVLPLLPLFSKNFGASGFVIKPMCMPTVVHDMCSIRRIIWSTGCEATRIMMVHRPTSRRPPLIHR